MACIPLDSCVAAGFLSCCTRNCELPSGCFCDIACYEHMDCCPDITDSCVPGKYCISGLFADKTLLSATHLHSLCVNAVLLCFDHACLGLLLLPWSVSEGACMHLSCTVNGLAMCFVVWGKSYMSFRAPTLKQLFLTCMVLM